MHTPQGAKGDGAGSAWQRERERSRGRGSALGAPDLGFPVAHEWPRARGGCGAGGQARWRAATGRAWSRCAVAGDSHRRRPRAVPRQRPGSGGAAWQRGEPAALARPARRGEVEEEDEGDRSRAALLAPVAALAARRERSGEGGSGRERARTGKEKQRFGEGKSEAGYYVRFAGF